MSTFNKRTLAIAVALSTAGVAHAAFEEVTTDNPFDAITSTGSNPSLVMMDLDADGDLDAVIFHQYPYESYPYNYGSASVWENTGTSSAPSFTHVRDNADTAYGTGENITENPFSAAYQNYYGHPVTAADLDGDNDLDFFGGQRCANSGDQLSYSEVASDGYGVVTGLTQYVSIFSGYGSNPFYGTGLAPSAASYGCGQVAFAAGDLTNEGDADIVATDMAVLRYYSNDSANATDVPQTMTELSGVNNPFYGTDGSALNLTGPYYGAPITLHDVDGDGDKDLVMGTVAAADMRLFINTGSASTPDFEEVSSDLNVATAGWAAPTFADVDGDGDDDLIVAEVNGSDQQSLRLFLQRPDGSDSDEGPFGGTGIGAMLVGALAMLRRRRR